MKDNPAGCRDQGWCGVDQAHDRLLMNLDGLMNRRRNRNDNGYCKGMNNDTSGPSSPGRSRQLEGLKQNPLL